jgi:hypothetical protein
MLQALKSYAQGLAVGESPTKKIVTMPQTHALSQPKSKLAFVALDYVQVCNAILITEYNDKGEETPVALAFVQKSRGVTVFYLYELADSE